MNKLVKKEKGFTIIEVVLVLAIAGLIFMVVFLAVPGLQRSQRDTQRKQDLGRLVSTITSMQSNNRGNIFTDPADYQPGSGGSPDGAVYAELVSGGSRFDDPSTHAPYHVADVDTDGTFSGSGAGLVAVGDIVIAINASCNDPVTGTNPFTTIGNSNASFAVAMKTEGGFYCQNG